VSTREFVVPATIHRCPATGRTSTHPVILPHPRHPGAGRTSAIPSDALRHPQTPALYILDRPRTSPAKGSQKWVPNLADRRKFCTFVRVPVRDGRRVVNLGLGRGCACWVRVSNHLLPRGLRPLATDSLCRTLPVVALRYSFPLYVTSFTTHRDASGLRLELSTDSAPQRRR